MRKSRKGKYSFQLWQSGFRVLASNSSLFRFVGLSLLWVQLKQVSASTSLLFSLSVVEWQPLQISEHRSCHLYTATVIYIYEYFSHTVIYLHSNIHQTLLTHVTISYYDLKCTAKKAEKHVHKFPLECKTFDAKQYAADQSSLSLYPDDAPELVPIEVYGDGNCLPRSASIFESGSQTHHEEMRTRIVVKLAAHGNHYLDSNNLDND